MLIKRCDQGQSVRILQQALNIHVDGDFGNETEQAVRAFQSQHGLHVDGEAGDETLGALGLDGSSMPPLPAVTAETAPPSEVASLPLGVDLYAGNAVDAPGFANLRAQGKSFAILKSSQGTVP